jgi:hypothetical protein
MQAVTKKIADTNPSGNKRTTEERQLILFNTKAIFKARKSVLF